MPTSYRSYGYRPGDRIIDLLMAQGQQRAEQAERTWGGIGESIAGIGQQIGGALEQRRAQQAEERKAGELRARDQAIAAVFESWDGRDASVLHRQLIRHTDPKTALDLAKGAESLQKLGAAPDPETAAKELLPIARGFKAASPEMRARLYPTAIRPSLIKSRLIPQEQLPEQYGPEVDQFTDYILGMQAPEKTSQMLKFAPGEVGVDPVTGEQRFAAPPKAEPTLAEIEAKAAAQARGTASAKPPKVGPEPEVIDAYVSDLQAGHKIWSDVPASLRNAVQVATSQAGIAPPTKRITEKTATELSAAQDLVSRTGELLANPVGAQEWAKATGIPDWVTQLTGWGSSAKANKAEMFLYVAETLKSIQGSRPSDKDMQWYLDNLPGIGEAPQTRDLKVKRIQERLTRAYNTRVRGLKKTGYALSGFDEIGEGPEDSSGGVIDLGIPGVTVHRK